MDMDKIQIGKFYKFEKLDKTGNNIIMRTGKVIEKWNTMLKLENMSGEFTCFYDQVVGKVE